MNWAQSMKEPCNGWKMEFGVLIAPDGERYGPADALTPKQVAQPRGVELDTINEEFPHLFKSLGVGEAHPANDQGQDK